MIRLLQDMDCAAPPDVDALNVTHKDSVSRCLDDLGVSRKVACTDLKLVASQARSGVPAGKSGNLALMLTSAGEYHFMQFRSLGSKQARKVFLDEHNRIKYYVV